MTCPFPPIWWWFSTFFVKACQWGNLHFPMVFQWFPYFLCVFLRISHFPKGFPKGFSDFPMGFPCFSYGFPIFLWVFLCVFNVPETHVTRQKKSTSPPPLITVPGHQWAPSKHCGSKLHVCYVYIKSRNHDYEKKQFLLCFPMIFPLS